MGTTTKRPLTFLRRLGWYAATVVARGGRVAVVGVVIVASLLVIAARVSIARASDVGMHFSDELMRIGEHHVGGDVVGDVYTIELNGQTFQSSNAASTHTMGEVLDYFQDQCRHHAGGLRDTFSHLGPAVEAKEPATGTEGALVVRRDDEDRGYVFCVAPDHALSATEKLHRMGRFGETSDLHTVGDLRYVAVRQVEGGTQIAAAWKDGPFNLLKLFPATGDVAGQDFGNVPRPDGGRRVLSGYIQGSAFGVNAYEVPTTIPVALAGLDTKLLAAGWQARSGGPDIKPNSGRFYALGSSLDLIVSASEAGRGGTQLTYVVSRNIGHLTP